MPKPGSRPSIIRMSPKPCFLRSAMSSAPTSQPTRCWRPGARPIGCSPTFSSPRRRKRMKTPWRPEMNDMVEQELSEQDLAKLIPEFYARVRGDPVLGSIFDGAIDDWDEHLEKLQAFWSSVMLMSGRSEEHTSELQSLMRISYAVFCLKKKKKYK